MLNKIEKCPYKKGNAACDKCRYGLGHFCYHPLVIAWWLDWYSIKQQTDYEDLLHKIVSDGIQDQLN